MGLWPHQENTINKAMNHEGFGIFTEMATGKTLSAIHVIKRMQAQSVLIVCPKSVIQVWPYEFEKHGFTQYKILTLDKGTVAKKAQVAKQFIEGHTHTKEPFVIVINYESIWRPPLGPVYNKANQLINAGLFLKTSWDCIVSDECHRISAPGSKVSFFMKRLGTKAKKRLGLTGTPLNGSPLSIYGQYRFLDPTVFGTSFHRFKMRYALYGGYQNHEIIDYINMDEFKMKLESISDRVRTQDVVDLPDRMFEIRTCQLCKSAQKIYNDLSKNFILEVSEGKLTTTTALTKLLRLQQLTGGSLPLDDGKYIEADDSKLNLLKDILIDFDTHEPVVIFCRFTKDIERVKKLCESKPLKRNVAELSGQMNQLQEWQNGKFDVLVVQIRAGGVGIDLTRSRYAIYYSMGYSLTDYEQSLARIHRPNQTRTTAYYTLIAENTIDMRVYMALKNKKKVVDDIIDSVQKGIDLI